MKVYTVMDGPVGPIVLVPCVSLLNRLFLAFWLK